MAEKTLKELLYKYLPPQKYASILEEGIVSRTRLDKDKRFLEVYARFENIISKDELYDIELQVKEAYKLNAFKLFPSYPAELFDYDYVPEILRETEREGYVARGFFSDYTYSLNQSNAA